MQIKKTDTRQPYKRYGDKKNSEYFEEYLLKIYTSRDTSGLSKNIGSIVTIVVEVDPGASRGYIAELCLMTPYHFERAFEDDIYRYYLMRISKDSPDLLIREIKRSAVNLTWNLNQFSPKGKLKPYTRYIGEVLEVNDLTETVKKLEIQGVKFTLALPPNASPHYIHWTQPSLFTWNQTGYVQSRKAAPEYEKIGDLMLNSEELELFRSMKTLQKKLMIDQYIQPIDHLATRVFCHDREHAILEFLTLSSYYFWGAYDITDQNSSTNITRNIKKVPETRSPAKVFTANNTPYYVNHIVGLPSPTEEFVRSYGRRMHHIAYAVTDGLYGKPEDDYQNVDFVVDQLKKAEKEFLLHVVGSCKEGLKQIFSKSSQFSYLITEYIQRCDEYEGFFTKENVGALTLAAGQDEKF